ncbi:MAG TPA: hypothetical protein VLJ37_08835 [bacterium]|nr:hypothetical protein [bacterium]
MGFIEALADVFSGGAYSAAKAAQEAQEAAAKAAHQAEQEAIKYASDNNKTVALGQIMTQRIALLQAGLDSEMQLAAQLEVGIEKLDTKLQVSLLEYRQQMTAEENRHAETMAKARKGLSDLQNTHSLGADLPPPEFDF